MTDIDKRMRMGRNDYEQIAALAADADSPVTEITEALYFYLLEVLPPMMDDRNAPGSYFICEYLTESQIGPVTVQFRGAMRFGEMRYYARYVVMGMPHTYMKPDDLYHSLPLDPHDADGYA